MIWIVTLLIWLAPNKLSVSEKPVSRVRLVLRFIVSSRISLSNQVKMRHNNKLFLSLLLLADSCNAFETVFPIRSRFHCSCAACCWRFVLWLLRLNDWTFNYLALFRLHGVFFCTFSVSFLVCCFVFNVKGRIWYEMYYSEVLITLHILIRQFIDFFDINDNIINRVNNIALIY